MSDGTKALEMARDGRWLIPVEQRPKGWERYGLEEVESQSFTVERTEHVVREERHTTERVSVTTQSQKETKPVEVSPVEVMSLIPAESGREQELVEACLIAYGDGLSDGEAERALDKVLALTEAIGDYRKAKKKVDSILSEWAERHKKTLRHIGTGSKVVQDLWSLFLVEAIANCRLERESRRMANGYERADPYGHASIMAAIERLPDPAMVEEDGGE